MGGRRAQPRRWRSRLAVVALIAITLLIVSAWRAPDDAGVTSESRALPLTVPLLPIVAPITPRLVMVQAPVAKAMVAIAPVPVSSPAPLRRLTFDFTGDTLVHSPLVKRAHIDAGGNGFDFTPMFARVAPILSAVDAAVCHLETPVAPPGEELSTFPLYGVPAEVATALAGAGYDRCSTASNHTMDRGVLGIDATVNALEAAGVSEAGMARAQTEAIPALMNVDGVLVAHLSYTYGLNGLRRPDDQPWRTNIIGDGRIIEDARAARASGAAIVIVSLHWGTEMLAAPTEEQRNIAALLAASGQVDLVVGTHAHVIQPIERVGNMWVLYGLGNFLSNMPINRSSPAATQDGVIVQVSFAEQADGRFTMETPVATPTWVDKNNGFVIRPVLADLADPTVSDAVKAQLLRSLERSRAVLGAFIPG